MKASAESFHTHVRGDGQIGLAVETFHLSRESFNLIRPNQSLSFRFAKYSSPYSIYNNKSIILAGACTSINCMKIYTQTSSEYMYGTYNYHTAVNTTRPFSPVNTLAHLQRRDLPAGLSAQQRPETSRCLIHAPAGLIADEERSDPLQTRSSPWNLNPFVTARFFLKGSRARRTRLPALRLRQGKGSRPATACGGPSSSLREAMPWPRRHTCALLLFLCCSSSSRVGIELQQQQSTYLYMFFFSRYGNSFERCLVCKTVGSSDGIPWLVRGRKSQ